MTTKIKEESETFCCADCEKISDTQFINTNCDEDYICTNCYDHYRYCNHCDNLTHEDDLTSIHNNNNMVCDYCIENNYAKCYECCEYFCNCDLREYEANSYCSRCYEEFDDSDNSSDYKERVYNTSDKYVEEGKRAYSTEIECYYPNREAIKKVQSECNTNFGISHDGSLGSNGVEFQSPKLSGKKGEYELIAFCKLLIDNKFTVDKKCGLHIHIDVSDFIDIEKGFIRNYGNDYIIDNTYNNKINKLKTLMTFYIIFEQLILSYLPKSRRKNHYCLPLSEYYYENEIRNITFIEDFEKMWYRDEKPENIDHRKNERYDSSRYAGINFHSMLAHGHIEIRFHSGTISPEKIMNWIILHTTIIDKINNNQIDRSKLSDVKYITELSDKQTAMFEMLALPTEVEEYFKGRRELFLGTSDDLQ